MQSAVSGSTLKPTTLAQWLVYIEALHPKSIAMGLDRVRKVADRLALNPDFPIITIAGTNGKGSTCAMLESIYRRAGYRVGSYASPHLARYNERIRINQQTISDDDLCDAFLAVENARGEITLTYFEIGTLAAVWHFVKSGLDVAILEVGMGGRLDAVNVFEPTCSILTSIDLDHMEYLGDTREMIGTEKAGIFRANKLAICGDESPPKTVTDFALEIDADLQLIGRDFKVSKTPEGWEYDAGKGKLALPPLALRGDFQLNNAACAICAVQNLNDVLPVADDGIGESLKHVVLVGRFHQLHDAPLIIVDVAHNPQAAKSLADNLQNNRCGGRTLGVFAMLADKDVAGVVSALILHISAWYLADINSARGAKAKDLAVYLQAQSQQGQTAQFDNVAEALLAACEEANKNDRIIVFGSFYTVADAIDGLNFQRV